MGEQIDLQRKERLMFTKKWLKGAAERAVKTAAQVLGAWILLATGTELIPEAGIHQIDWATGLSLTASATVLSVITSIGNADFTAGH